MCGRIVMSLSKEQIQCECIYKNKENISTEPQWADEDNNGKTFKPSYNIAPGEVTPVLMSSRVSNEANRILKPMIWGLIPPWHKIDMMQKIKTNNCRIENIKSSNLYNPILKNGKRCIILVEGFFEWNTTNKSSEKQPYYIYVQQSENTEKTAKEDQKRIKLLHLAGLYDVWKHNGETVYSYTIITMESSTELTWLHHRMPAVLDTEEQIEAWLAVEKVDPDAALSYLRQSKILTWHPVSKIVNNSRNKLATCIERMDIKSSKIKNIQTLLDSFIKKRKSSDQTDNSTNKKKKS